MPYRRRLRLLATLCLGLAATAPHAAPAPWYLWRSLVDGRSHCAQSSPGPGWERERGPYRDLHCSRPAAEPASAPSPQSARDGRPAPARR